MDGHSCSDANKIKGQGKAGGKQMQVGATPVLILEHLKNGLDVHKALLSVLQDTVIILQHFSWVGIKI